MEQHLTPDDLLELLPLAPAGFFVLFALADGPKHGYRIMQEIKLLSAGAVAMGPATLYTTIQRLVDRLFLEEVSPAVDDRRRTYRLTRAGKQLLEAELHRQNEVVLLARARKILRPEGKA